MSNKQDNKAKRPIIIKKKKGGHGGAHGGSWKVAYADFVTAMMAFFLLMWLLSMSSPESKKALQNYFQEFSIFDKSGASISDAAGKSGPEAVIVTNNPMDGREAGTIGGDKSGVDDLARKMRLELEAQLADLKDQVIVERFENGVRIHIVDREGQPVFPSGSATPTPQGRKLMAVVASDLAKLDNKIAIEGHTDARPYTSGRLSNWDLSTDRASSARREFAAGGVGEGRLSRVAGYGSTDLFDKDNPADPRNRRITVLIFENPKKDAGAGAIIDGLTDSFGERKPAKAPQPPVDPVEERIQRIYDNAPKTY